MKSTNPTNIDVKEITSLLTICIPTHNRCKYLDRTLTYLLNSPFKNCPIFVFNNASTDETKKLAEKYCEVTFITHKFNIGGSANILRSAEYASTPYLWIIGDDDEYDFSDISDIIDVMKEGKVGLLQVGAHTDKEWLHGGRYYTPRNAYNCGYQYFRFASFIGCDIFKTEVFRKYISKGYNNAINFYPHMPCIFSFWENNEDIYISKNRIAKAIIGNQCYDNEKMLNWWAETCLLINSDKDRKACFFDQFCFQQKNHFLNEVRVKCWKGIYHKTTLKKCLHFYNTKERILSLAILPLRFCKSIYYTLTR